MGDRDMSDIDNIIDLQANLRIEQEKSDESQTEFMSDAEKKRVEKKNRKMQRDRGWNSELENMCKRMGEECAAFQWMHRRSGYFYGITDRLLNVLLTFFTGGSGVSSLTGLATNTQWVIIVSAIIPIVVALAMAIQQAYNISTRALTHHEIADRYATLYTMMDWQTSRYRTDRLNVDLFLEMWMKKYYKVKNIDRVDIPFFYIKQYEKKVLKSGKNITNPSDIYGITINDLDNMQQHYAPEKSHKFKDLISRATSKISSENVTSQSSIPISKGTRINKNVRERVHKNKNENVRENESESESENKNENEKTMSGGHELSPINVISKKKLQEKGKTNMNKKTNKHISIDMLPFQQDNNHSYTNREPSDVSVSDMEESDIEDEKYSGENYAKFQLSRGFKSGLKPRSKAEMTIKNLPLGSNPSCLEKE